MGIYQVELSLEEEKALLTNMTSISTWINIFVHHSANKLMDKIVEEYSDKQPSKISHADRNLIVRAAKVKSATDRNMESLEMIRR